MRCKFCIVMTLCMILATVAVAHAQKSSNPKTSNQVSNDTSFANDPVGITIPTIITIQRPEDLKPRTDWVKPVRFYHAMHATYHACFDCHHEETNRYKEQGSESEGFMPCTDCHADEGILEPLSFYAAWHAKSPISCVGCHWQYHLKGNNNPPLSCTRGCHPNAHLSPQTISQAAHALQSGASSPSSSPSSPSSSMDHAQESSSPVIAWEVSPPQKASQSSMTHVTDLKE